jgi:hypothetical protein
MRNYVKLSWKSTTYEKQKQKAESRKPVPIDLRVFVRFLSSFYFFLIQFGPIHSTPIFSGWVVVFCQLALYRDQTLFERRESGKICRHWRREAQKKLLRRN